MMEQSEHSNSAGYEKRDVNIRWLLGVSAVVIVFIVVAIALLEYFFAMSKEQIIYEAVLQPESVSLRELHAREAEALGSYGIVSTDSSGQSVYRVPITRAMELVAEESHQTSTRE